jgi:hypothetical protein
VIRRDPEFRELPPKVDVEETRLVLRRRQHVGRGVTSTRSIPITFEEGEAIAKAMQARRAGA